MYDLGVARPGDHAAGPEYDVVARTAIERVVARPSYEDIVACRDVNDVVPARRVIDGVNGCGQLTGLVELDHPVVADDNACARLARRRRCNASQDDRVAPKPAEHVIAAVAAGDQVIAADCRADCLEGAQHARRLVLDHAVAAENDVVPIAEDDRIGPRASEDDVVAVACNDHIAICELQVGCLDKARET